MYILAVCHHRMTVGLFIGSGMHPFQFSVVIVTYNNCTQINDCLSSLALALSSCTSQLFIIDNGSTDGTIDRLNGAAHDRFTQCTIICNQTNTGFTRAVNVGLKQCRGQYILLLNPDVTLQRNTLSTLRSCLEGSPDIGLVAPQLRNIDGSIQPSCRRFPRKRDVFFELCGIRPRVVVGGPVLAEEVLRHGVDADVGGLGGENGGHEQLQRVRPVQLGVGVGVFGLQAGDDLLGVALFFVHDSRALYSPVDCLSEGAFLQRGAAAWPR